MVIRVNTSSFPPLSLSLRRPTPPAARSANDGPRPAPHYPAVRTPGQATPTSSGFPSASRPALVLTGWCGRAQTPRGAQGATRWEGATAAETGLGPGAAPGCGPQRPASSSTAGRDGPRRDGARGPVARLPREARRRAPGSPVVIRVDTDHLLHLLPLPRPPPAAEPPARRCRNGIRVSRLWVRRRGRQWARPSRSLDLLSSGRRGPGGTLPDGPPGSHGGALGPRPAPVGIAGEVARRRRAPDLPAPRPAGEHRSLAPLGRAARKRAPRAPERN